MSFDTAQGDLIWARIVDALEAAGDQRDAFLARLVLILANEVDDLETVLEAIEDASIE